MAFGPIMQLKVGERNIELAPIKKEEVAAFVSPGMQQFGVTKYLGRGMTPVLEDEQEWFERVRTAKNSVVWGIYDVTNSRRLIGSTSLMDIEGANIVQSTSGSMICDKSYWGGGIASAIHKARTWYAFSQLGHTRIKSAVVHGNIASRKALEKSGYALVYIERNTAFIDSAWHHQDNMECLNPADLFWKQWWGSDRPPLASRLAREQARAALAWVAEHVTLP